MIREMKDVLNKDSLIPMIELMNEARREEIIEETGFRSLPAYSEILDMIKYLDEDIEYFYINPSAHFSPIVFYKDVILIEVSGKNVEDLKTLHIKERINVQMEVFKKAMSSKDFKKLLYVVVDERLKFVAYKELFPLIPDNEKYEIFIDLYTHSDYGFGFLETDFIEKAFSYKPKKKDKKYKGIKTDKNGYVTIYRGMGTHSTPIGKAFSWTTSFDTAIFFATRLSLGSLVYKAKVHIDNIIEYLTDRNEFEVLVRPKDVIDLVKLDLLDSQETIERLNELGFIDIYHMYAERISPELFKNSRGIHGISHAKRVLLLSLVLADLEDIFDSDLDILAFASVYHDIGRINDDEDCSHGVMSYTKLNDLNLLKRVYLDKTDKAILRFIIENHCVSDEIALEKLKSIKSLKGEMDRVIKLYRIFKDADGLDRVRIKDLDTKYLRTKSASKMVLLAHQFLHGVR